MSRRLSFGSRRDRRATSRFRRWTRLASTLGARSDLRLSWNGEALDRLIDAEHARLVEVVATFLGRAGWEVAAEVTFWIRGERGSLDLLGVACADAVGVVVEIKSVVPDQQSMLAAHDRKCRLGLEIAKSRGWSGAAVAKLLVIRESRTSRRRVEAHATTFGTEFPDRALAVRRWLERPEASRPLRGLWFLSDGRQAEHSSSGPLSLTCSPSTSPEAPQLETCRVVPTVDMSTTSLGRVPTSRPCDGRKCGRPDCVHSVIRRRGIGAIAAFERNDWAMEREWFAS